MLRKSKIEKRSYLCNHKRYNNNLNCFELLRLNDIIGEFFIVQMCTHCMYCSKSVGFDVYCVPHQCQLAA